MESRYSLAGAVFISNLPVNTLCTVPVQSNKSNLFMAFEQSLCHVSQSVDPTFTAITSCLFCSLSIYSNNLYNRAGLEMK